MFVPNPTRISREVNLYYFDNISAPNLEERVRTFEVEMDTTFSGYNIRHCSQLSETQATQTTEKRRLGVCHGVRAVECFGSISPEGCQNIPGKLRKPKPRTLT